MGKVKKEKLSLNNKIFNKRNFIILGSIIFTIICSLIVFKIKQDKKIQEEQILLREIKSSYSDVIKIRKDTNLYDNKNKIIGEVKKDFIFILDKENINSIADKYFKVKNTDYYVYYKDIIKTEKRELNTEYDKYLIFNKNVKTDKETTFYDNDKEVINIKESINIPLRYMDTDYYYVVYLDKLLKIKKESSSLIDNTNTEEKESEYISSLRYEKIYDKNKEKCNSETCIDIDKVREHFDYIKQNGFYTITLNEYKNWLEGNIRLKEKAILITTNNNNDCVKTLMSDYKYNINLLNDEYKFNQTNMTNTRENKTENSNEYKIKSITPLDDIEDIVLGKKIVERFAQRKYNGQSIAVLNYHFFYDPNIGESCNENICLQTDRFKEQLKYLNDNGYKTLTMNEFIRWMYGEIELPNKSVLITIDDGAMGTSTINGNKLIPIIEEYNINATLFLVTEWWNKSNYQSSRLDVESHGNDIHKTGTCGQANIHCLSQQDLLNDLKTSINKLGTSQAFCYPFYALSASSVEVVKQAGFKVAFGGGNYKATRNSNKYNIPRYPIYKSTSMQQFINMVS